jgi:hypothetical protein
VPARKFNIVNPDNHGMGPFITELELAHFEIKIHPTYGSDARIRWTERFIPTLKCKTTRWAIDTKRKMMRTQRWRLEAIDYADDVKCLPNLGEPLRPKELKCP